MRITFICPPLDLSGGQRVIATYAERLSQRGHQVVLVAPAPPRPGFREILRDLVRLRRWHGWPKLDSHVARAVVNVRVLDSYRPVTASDVPDADVVIATWWETAEWVMSYPESKGTKVYFVQHHEVFDYLPVWRVRSTYRLPMSKIVVAQWLANVLKNDYGDNAACVVPNAVDHLLFSAARRSRNVRFTVGLMYADAAFKGCDVSIRALEIAKAAIPEMRVVAFGSCEQSSLLPLPSGTEYHARPPQSRIPDLYSQCDGWLFGSRSEGFGLPILEAMACRTPVIGAPAGAAPELLSQGGGYLVRPEDPEDMAAAILRLCRLPEGDWRNLSDAAHRTAMKYTWEASADLFERALVAAMVKSAVR